MDETSLRAAFDKLMACFERGDVEGFMAGLDPGLAMFDEDIPFRLNKAGFQGHVGLLAQNMESMAFIPRDTKFAAGQLSKALGELLTLTLPFGAEL